MISYDLLYDNVPTFEVKVLEQATDMQVGAAVFTTRSSTVDEF